MLTINIENIGSINLQLAVVFHSAIASAMVVTVSMHMHSFVAFMIFIQPCMQYKRLHVCMGPHNCSIYHLLEQFVIKRHYNI